MVILMGNYSDTETRMLTEKIATLDRDARAEQNELDRKSQEKQTAMLASAIKDIAEAIRYQTFR